MNIFPIFILVYIKVIIMKCLKNFTFVQYATLNFINSILYKMMKADLPCLDKVFLSPGHCSFPHSH